MPGSRRPGPTCVTTADGLSAAAPRRIRDKASTVTGADWQTRIAGKTGIVYCENHWLREGEKTPTGDHIDLWNGSRMTASGLQGAIVTALRFGLDVGSGPGFSDFRAALLVWVLALLAAFWVSWTR
jgi:Type VI secretion system (T6SS), amidase effector protein 4